MGSLRMDWSATSATKAYLDTIKLCNYDIHKRRRESKLWKTRESGSSEFVSALAAGMRAKLIVEVTSAASPWTIALAAAARQTGGRLVCILPEPQVLAESKRVIRDSGLKDLVHFETGDPTRLLQRHANVDFSLVNCTDWPGGSPPCYTRLLGSIDVNPRRSVVVATNHRLGFGGDFRRVLNDQKRLGVMRSVKQYPIGKGMEVITMIEKRQRSRSGAIGKDVSASSGSVDCNSRWVVEFDEESGEEHIFRLPRSRSSRY